MFGSVYCCKQFFDNVYTKNKLCTRIPAVSLRFDRHPRIPVEEYKMEYGVLQEYVSNPCFHA